MKNPLPLIILSSLIIILGYIAFLYLPQGSVPQDEGGQAYASCRDGQSRPCTSGSCSGQSTCIGGEWVGCSWEQVCDPGMRVPCVNMGCADSLKECDACGTGWGSCKGFNSS